MKTRILSLIGIAGTLVGGTQLSSAQQIDLSQIPAAIQQIINSKLAAAGIASVQRTTANGAPLYQVRLNVPGLEPFFATDTGTIVNVPNGGNGVAGQNGSFPATFDQLPVAVQNAIRTQAGTSPVQSINVVSANGKSNYTVTYNRNGQTVGFWVDPVGNLISGVLPVYPSPVRLPLSDIARVAFNDLPTAVQSTLQTYARGVPVDNIIKGVLKGMSLYQADLRRDGQKTALRLTPSGALIWDDVNDRYLADIGMPPSSSYVAQVAMARPAQVPDWRTAPPRMPLSGVTRVALDEVPPAVRNTILAYSGGAPVSDVRQGMLGGQAVYQTGFGYGGRDMELRVANNGALINDQVNDRFLAQLSSGQNNGSGVGQAPSWQSVSGTAAASGLTPLQRPAPIALEHLPPAVQTTIQAQAGSSPINSITQGLLDGGVVYDALYNRSGQTVQLRIADDGSILGSQAGVP